MFTINNYTLSENDIERFITDPYTVYTLEESKLSEQEASAKIHSAAEKADMNIDTILKETIQDINDEYLRNWFRGFLVSLKYDILPRYPRGGTPQYAVMYASDKCVLVNSPHIVNGQEIIKPTSTIVLSPEGVIMIPEGEVWINESSLSLHGFNAKWNGLLGLYTENGKVLFPCVFENLSNPEIERTGTMQYNGFRYRYILEGMKSEMGADKIERVASKNSLSMAFVCENKVYSIEFMGYNNDGFIHKGGISVLCDEEDSFNTLPEDKKKDVATKNTEELFGIIRTIHASID